MPDEPHQDTLHLINGHIHILNDAAIEHTSWHMPITAFLLKVAETPQDDAFPVGKTISDIGYMVMRITVRQWMVNHLLLQKVPTLRGVAKHLPEPLLRDLPSTHTF